MEPEILISDNKDYQEIIKQGIKRFNNEKHPEIEVFKNYREKGYNDTFGFYAICVCYKFHAQDYTKQLSLKTAR